ncbi:hypothetical protein MES4922_60132 [Mesorhizobium ventifaucium]|uniref:Uncharacterized protein n=1 Tax=Mesorhizobium ventifaucium TaxID=666020 RepID=A0ABN8KCL0_9HYPH|nr:hypothetical protein MES4922_60132 [Mesorhizobium ventifaucium]
MQPMISDMRLGRTWGSHGDSPVRWFQTKIIGRTNPSLLLTPRGSTVFQTDQARHGALAQECGFGLKRSDRSDLFLILSANGNQGPLMAKVIGELETYRTGPEMVCRVSGRQAGRPSCTVRGCCVMRHCKRSDQEG